MDDVPSCECDEGYHADGLACVENQVDPCDGVSCSGYGTCVTDASDVPSCECDDGYHADGLACVEDQVDPCDPSELRAEALENGAALFNGVNLPEATPIVDILADMGAYEGDVVQIEGLVTEICSHAGCWALLEDPTDLEGTGLMIKVNDGVMDFRTVMEIGNFVIGEGVFTENGTHGPQVFIENHGAMVGTTVCPVY